MANFSLLSGQHGNASCFSFGVCGVLLRRHRPAAAAAVVANVVKRDDYYHRLPAGHSLLSPIYR